MAAPLNYTQTTGATRDRNNPTSDDYLNIARLAWNSAPADVAGQNVPNPNYNPNQPTGTNNPLYINQKDDLGSNANTWSGYAAAYLKNGTTGYAPYDQYFATAVAQHYGGTTAAPPNTPVNTTVQGDQITPTPTTQALQGLSPLPNSPPAPSTPTVPGAPGTAANSPQPTIPPSSASPLAPPAGGQITAQSVDPGTSAPAAGSTITPSSGGGIVTAQNVFDYLNANPSSRVGSRQIPGQDQLEYYDTQTGQGFPTPQALADFVNQQNQTGTSGGSPGTGLQPEIDAIMKEWGLTPPSPTTSPLISFSDSYKKVFTDLGLPDLATQIKDITQKYSDLNAELQSKISDISEDPWLTQGIRDGRIKQLQDRYDLKLTALSSQMTLMNTMYDKGVSQAQFVAQQTMSQASAQQTLDKDLLIKAMDIASRQAIAQINLTKPFRLSAGQTDYAYNPDTGQFEPIASVAPKPQVVSGSKYGKYEVAPDGTLVPVGGGGGGGTGAPTSTTSITEATNMTDQFIQSGNNQYPGVGSDGYVSPETYNAARDAWEADGHPVSTFDTRFAKYINPGDPQDYKGAKIPKPNKGSQGTPVGFAGAAA